MKKKFIIIAGPCVVESFDLLDTTASKLIKLISNYEIDFYFKSSYKKANRTSINSFTGLGDIKALEFLYEIKNKYNVKVLTDVHTVEEIKLAKNYVDALQIPAFLSRQTELLVAAGESGKIVNIKKAQFMAPKDIIHAVNKVKSTGNDNIIITERGTTFGYNDLVVDMRSLLIMKEAGVPIIYDATHSLQLPSIGETSGGLRDFVLPLARAATAVGIDGIFFETHPKPNEALSDSATQLALDDVEKFLSQIIAINNLIKK